MSYDDERSRAVRFLRSRAVRTAGRVEELPYGVAVLNDALPLVWDLNFVWVDAVPAGMTAAALSGEADRLLGAAGLAHRQVVVADERGGDGLAVDLEELGWSTGRHVIMAHRRPPDRPAELALVELLDLELARRFSEQGLVADPAGFSEEAIRQLATEKEVAAAAGARFLGVPTDGGIACACDLYLDAGVAQIEAVMTLEPFRNRGLARAVVLRALAEARRAGCDLVFLVAERDDWPRGLYRKLGFDAVATIHVLRRTPALDGRGPGG